MSGKCVFGNIHYSLYMQLAAKADNQYGITQTQNKLHITEVFDKLWIQVLEGNNTETLLGICRQDDEVSNTT